MDGESDIMVMSEDFMTDEGAWISEHMEDMKSIYKNIIRLCGQYKDEGYLQFLDFQVFCSMMYRYSVEEEEDDDDDDDDNDDEEEDESEEDEEEEDEDQGEVEATVQPGSSKSQSKLKFRVRK